MAKITDPDLLNQGTEVIFNPTARTITLIATGNLDAVDGVTFQALYSFAKEEWRTDSNLIKFPFPFIAITGEQFEVFNGWDFASGNTKNYIKDGGWALRDINGVVQEEYMNITSLGLFNNSSLDRAYYLQVDGGTPVDIVNTGEVNQAIKIYGGTSYGNFNYRNFFKIYLREQGKIYGFYDLIAEQNISALTYRKYALPLVNALDLKIDASDIEIDSDSNGIADVGPYSGMSITYYTSGQTRTIGSSSYNFSIIINGNNGTAEQIYEFVQWSLRQTVDIDAGAANRRGDTSQELLQFIGDTLRTRFTEDGGVFIDNFQPADTNRLEFTDDTNTIRTFPFVAAGNIIFNDNLSNDAGSKYFVFFSNDDAGDNTGRDFGTANAILIKDNSGVDITGDVSGRSVVGFDYDYDNNIQRGAASAGTNAPFTAISLGLSTAQYVVTTGSITRTTANVINFVAALERNYFT
jgi:hypothetical protein